MKRIFSVDVYLAQENEYTLDIMLLSIRKESHHNACQCPWNVYTELAQTWGPSDRAMTAQATLLPALPVFRLPASPPCKYKVLVSLQQIILFMN